MRDRLRGWVEGIAASLVATVLFSLILAGGAAFWAGFSALAEPEIVAVFVAVAGGVLGLMSFTNRHLSPRPICLQFGGMEWTELPKDIKATHYGGIIPCCPEHHVQVFNRTEGDAVLREISPASAIGSVYCVDGGGHALDVDLARLGEIMAGARALVTRERMKRRQGAP